MGAAGACDPRDGSRLGTLMSGGPDWLSSGDDWGDMPPGRRKPWACTAPAWNSMAAAQSTDIMPNLKVLEIWGITLKTIIRTFQTPYLAQAAG